MSSNRKYELTDEVKFISGVKLHRIKSNKNVWECERRRLRRIY